MWNKQLVAFDVETTGVDIDTDRIVSAAVSVVGNKYLPEHLNWLVNPGVAIPAEATAVHGISNEKARRGADPRQAIEEIIEVIASKVSDEVPLVVFNARFDVNILDREARRYKIKPLTSRTDLKVIDPLIIDKAADPYRPGRRTLPVVCEHYGVQFEESHQADNDALGAARLAWRIGNDFQLGQQPLSEVHDKQIAWAREQAESLQKHFDKKGINETVRPEWPFIPLS